MTNWSKEWPTEPGDYWFYGWRFRDRETAAPRFYHVEVRKTRSGLCYIAEGHFLYRAEGVWQPADLPAPPWE